MMIERRDHHVSSEPFSVAYYDGPQRRSDRYEVSAPEATIDNIVARLLDQAENGPVFVKDMAYHAIRDEAGADAEMLARFTNTFLIRDPAWSVPSFARRWPDFTREEAGFDALDRFVSVVESLGDPVVIIDNDDLRGETAGTVRAWCDAVGIPFVPEALTWEPGQQVGWDRWAEWHETTTRSTGFLPRTAEPPPPVDDSRVADAITAAQPVYARLRERRLRPAAGP